jgi:hypothetical protein
MAPEKLDKLLSKFYAEVKKRDGTDYEPDSLRIMQSAIERYLKENGYKTSIVRDRDFRNSQEVLNAKAINLRREGMGKRPNKAQPLAPEEENSLRNKGQLGEHNGRVLTNVNFKNLTEQLGLRGRQEHYDSYVEDFLIRRQEDRGELVEYRQKPTKTRTGGLRIKRRSTPQMMFSTDGGERDPVRLFKLWLTKRPDGMKDNGPLYLTIINRPKSADVWYARVRMGENTIGNIGKSMASCLNTSKKLTNHSMRKTLVSKLKSAGQARNVICEITGHSRESSLDDYDEISENQRRDLSHIISGYHDASKSKQNPECQLQRESAASPPASSINKYPASSSTVVTSNFQQQTHQLNQNFQPYGFPFFSPTYAPAVPHQTTAFNPWASCTNGSSNPQNTNYSGCTINNYYGKPQDSPPPRKKRRAFVIESDDED